MWLPYSVLAVVLLFFAFGPLLSSGKLFWSILFGEHKTKKRQVILVLFVSLWIIYSVSVIVYLPKLFVKSDDPTTRFSLVVILVWTVFLIVNFVSFIEFVDRIRRQIRRRDLKNRIQTFLDEVVSMGWSAILKDFLDLSPSVSVLDLASLIGFITQYGAVSTGLTLKIELLMRDLKLDPENDYPDMRETLRLWVFFEDSHGAKLNSAMALTVT